MRKGKDVLIIAIISSLISLILILINEIKNSPGDGFFNNILKSKSSPNTVVTQSENKEFSDLTRLIEEQEGIFGLYIKDMSSNKTYEYNTDENFYPLSLYKIPVSYLVARDVDKGDISWEDEITYTKDDYFDQYGTVASSGFGSQYKLEKIVELMLRESDNSAYKMIKNSLGEDYLDDEFKKITGNKNRQLFDEEELISPKEFSLLFENIFFKNWLNDQSKEKLLSYMYPTSYDNTISLYLKDDLTFYHKVGLAGSQYHDCGLVKNDTKNIIVCLMTGETTEESLDFVSNKTAEFINNLAK